MVLAHVILLAASFVFLSAQVSYAEGEPPALDAVCKSDPLPAGFVAVGEMESPECKASNPGYKNA
jgi:hypothetical protein